MESDSYSSLFSFHFLQIGFQPWEIGAVVAILLILVLAFIQALLVISEISYWGLTQSDFDILNRSKNKVSEMVLRHLKRPEWLEATILLSKIFVSVAITVLLIYFVEKTIDFGQLTTVKLIVETLVIGTGVLIFNIILPKTFKPHYCRHYAGQLAYPLLILGKLTYPISYLLVKSNLIAGKHKPLASMSINELSNTLNLNSNELTDEKEMLEGIVKFGNLYVSEIMTPRVDVIDADLSCNFSELLKIVIDSGYSRIPVCDETLDNVKGILYVKDLLPHLNKDKEFIWQSLIRKAYYVPESKKVNVLLSEFKAEKLHMAIVVDEYGGTAGIVTLEDILEEIVGEINDEMDDDPETHIRLSDGSIIFEGKTLLDDFYKITNTDDATELEFESIRGDAETLAGLLLELKGEIPQKGEIIKFNNSVFTIVLSDNRRIKKIKYKKLESQVNG